MPNCRGAKPRVVGLGSKGERQYPSPLCLSSMAANKLISRNMIDLKYAPAQITSKRHFIQGTIEYPEHDKPTSDGLNRVQIIPGAYETDRGSVFYFSYKEAETATIQVIN